jgi:2-methylisocitrate lyase-like PEP mutase family enzyme
MPDLPNFETLKNLGISRISTGNFIASKIYNQMETIVREMVTNQNCSSLF